MRRRIGWQTDCPDYLCSSFHGCDLLLPGRGGGGGLEVEVEASQWDESGKEGIEAEVEEGGLVGAGQGGYGIWVEFSFVADEILWTGLSIR